jgi:cyclophilin family peptidyl-prolyl cis-trans isomerase
MIGPIPWRSAMTSRTALSVLVLATAAVFGAATATARQTKPAAAGPPILVLETVKGTIEITFFPAEAPKSVEHIVALARNFFYRGQRFHRAEPSLVQFGDPRSRDMTYKEHWGTGGSGRPINAFEVSKKRQHVRGTVGLGHSGNAMAADSQLYIMKRASPSLDGKYAIIGQVTAGMPVVDRIEVADSIKTAYLKGEKK